LPLQSRRSGAARVVYGNNNTNVSYEGIDATYFTVRNLTIGKGQQFSQNDVDSGNHVRRHRTDLATTLFGRT